MRKLVIILSFLFVLSTIAVAESDLAGLSTDDLIAQRDAINHELAQRSMTGSEAQTIDVDGMLISIDSVYTGTGSDDAPAICILFNVCNPTDTSRKLINDIGCDILQDGIPLDGSYFRSDTYKGPSASNSMTAVIAPGAVDMKICEVGVLVSDSEHFTINLSRKHTSVSEDPYCGSFDFMLSDYLAG